MDDVGNLQSLVKDAAKADFLKQFGDGKTIDQNKEETETVEPLTEEEKMAEEIAEILAKPPETTSEDRQGKAEDLATLKTALSTISEDEQNAIDRKASQLAAEEADRMTDEEKSKLPEGWEVRLWTKHLQQILKERNISK